MDLKLIETGNGGDLVKLGDNLELINGFQNMPYLAMFGGNVEQSTPQTRKLGEQNFDWWGNSLLFPTNSAIQFNSLTEKTLMNVSLNSAGRVKIQNAILSDLNFMNAFAKVEVEVSLLGLDKVKIFLKILQPNNLESDEFIYIWDSTNFELSENGVSKPRDWNYIITDNDEIIELNNGDLLIY